MVFGPEEIAAVREEYQQLMAAAVAGTLVEADDGGNDDGDAASVDGTDA